MTPPGYACLGAVLAAVMAGGCQTPAGSAADAGSDVPVHEVPPPVDAGPKGLAVDFTVSGCPSFDPAAPSCKGPAPLTLSFVPVTSPSVGTFQWDFGDRTPRSVTRTPSHVFTLPGSYDVTLTVAAASDTASKIRPSFVTVTASPTGALCDVDAQCEPGRTCLCVPGTPGCPMAFARGLCTSTCTADCGMGATCVDLGLSAGGDPMAAAEPWRKALCLQSCEVDSDCAPGLRCRYLPTAAAGPGSPWVTACFLAVPADIGGSCRSASGSLQSSTCATGACFDLGAMGLCSLDCAAVSCPPGSACGKLGDGRALCFKTCSVTMPGGAADCTADPLLACEAPGAPGSLGFSVAAAPSGATYCAPRRCTADKDCGPAGTCTASSGGNHCVRK